MNNTQITGSTKLLGLLGSPVAHSISPMMHNEAFRILGLDCVYLCFDVTEETLKKAVDGLVSMGAVGFNCTMPVKNKMALLADELTPAAGMTGAVNTVVIKDGRLIGHNTDGTGYMRAAADAGINLSGKTMTLLGAGGAASSIFVQAALDGVKEIHLFSLKDQFWNRAREMVENVRRTTDCDAILHEIGNDSELAAAIEKSDILTNATSVGMAPDTGGCLINDPSMLRPDLIVSDVIYNPRSTKLLEMAKERGCRTFNGLYMLLYQGAQAFKIWTGKDMPTDIIKEKYFNAK